MARGVDDLGLRSAMADRLLPLLVGAMSFLAALAIAGALAAATLAGHWQAQAGGTLTVQVPDPALPAATGGMARGAAVLAALQAAPDVSAPRLLTAAELDHLLRPWLGADLAQLAVPVPAVITAGWSGLAAPDAPDALRAQLAGIVPGTLVETGSRWAAAVATLTASIQACAAAMVAIVTLVAAALVAVATRAGIAQRREAITIIHGLGALDSDIAGRFAGRATRLAGIGAVCGALVALPVLFWLAVLAAPFAGGVPGRFSTSLPAALPVALWAALPCLPLAAAAIGWATAQFTVRRWLRRLA